MLDLLRAFGSSGFEFFIASPEQEPYAEQFHELTKKFFEIPSRSFSPIAFFQLLRAIRRARIDVIHSHGRAAGIYSRLLGLATGVRVLHTFHGIHREPSFNGRLKLLVDQILSYFPFTPIYVSENESREAIQFGCVRPGVVGFVIENAVDTSRFGSRKAPPMSGASLRIGAFVRDDVVKGPDLLLSLTQEFSGAGQWTCAGISRAELSVHGDVPDQLEILDRLREPATWLQSLDIFVSTARNEGLPLGVLEAMAAGCLCVLSDIPAHVNFKAAALLFNPEDSASFSNALSRLKSDPSLRLSLLEKERELIANRHSLEAFAGKLARAYSTSASN